MKKLLFLALMLCLSYSVQASERQDKQSELIKYHVAKKDIHEAKNRVYYSVILDIPKGKYPTLNDIEPIYNQLFDKKRNKIAMNFYVSSLNSVNNKYGAYAGCGTIPPENEISKCWTNVYPELNDDGAVKKWLNMDKVEKILAITK